MMKGTVISYGGFQDERDFYTLWSHDCHALLYWFYFYVRFFMYQREVITDTSAGHLIGPR